MKSLLAFIVFDFLSAAFRHVVVEAQFPAIVSRGQANELLWHADLTRFFGLPLIWGLASTFLGVVATCPFLGCINRLVLALVSGRTWAVRKVLALRSASWSVLGATWKAVQQLNNFWFAHDYWEETV